MPHGAELLHDFYLSDDIFEFGWVLQKAKYMLNGHLGISNAVMTLHALAVGALT